MPNSVYLTLWIELSFNNHTTIEKEFPPKHEQISAELCLFPEVLRNKLDYRTQLPIF